MRIEVPDLSTLRCDCGSDQIAAMKVGYDGGPDEPEDVTRVWCVACWTRMLSPRPPLFGGQV